MNRPKENIYAHFRPEERLFVDQAWEWTKQAAERRQVKTTFFLDPRQQDILRTIVNRERDAQVRFCGGSPSAERCRAVIAPDDAEIADDDFALSVIRITSDDALFPRLDHGDFLGAVLGTGLKRECIGDIHWGKDECHIVVEEEIADYVVLHLREVHRTRVWTEKLPIGLLRPVEPEMELLDLTVASMRLDGIVSDVVRMSRAKAAAPIRAGHCRVNWKVEQNPATMLKEGDVVSLKGYGRFKLLSVEGTTRSGRIRVRAGKYV